MDKLATMDTIGSGFRPWLSCQGICLLNRHQTGDTDSVQPVILLPVQRDNQETFILCEARMLWYSADRTSSQQFRDTTRYCRAPPAHTVRHVRAAVGETACGAPVHRHPSPSYAGCALPTGRASPNTAPGVCDTARPPAHGRHAAVAGPASSLQGERIGSQVRHGRGETHTP